MYMYVIISPLMIVSHTHTHTHTHSHTESYKILPVKDAQREKSEYSIVGNKIIRFSKKTDKDCKDEFDLV